MSTLIEKLISVVATLEGNDISYALGGALALANYLPKDSIRTTYDIDLNIFSESREASKTLSSLALPEMHGADPLEVAKRDGQVRLLWDDTPVDLFFADIEFCKQAEHNALSMTLRDRVIPILSVSDLVTCKVIFNRDKDWLDVASVRAHPKLDWDSVHHWVSVICGTDSVQWHSLVEHFRGFNTFESEQVLAEKSAYSLIYPKNEQ